MSAGLFETRAEIVLRVRRGAPDESAEVERVMGPAPVPAHGARVLCRGHHRALSTLDAEAIRVRRALEELAAAEDSPILRAGSAYQIDGHLYARWLCKCFCGATTAHDLVEPGLDFVRYAFGQPTTRRLHFYFPQRVGEDSPLGREKGASLTTMLTDQAEYHGFLLKLWGLPTFVADAETLRVYEGEAEHMIDRLARVEVVSHGAAGPSLLMSTALRINFHWSGDPPLELEG